MNVLFLLEYLLNFLAFLALCKHTQTLPKLSQPYYLKAALRAPTLRAIRASNAELRKEPISPAIYAAKTDFQLPKGSMYWCAVYLGLQGVPVSLLRGLCTYYIGTWTLWVVELQELRNTSGAAEPKSSEGLNVGAERAEVATPTGQQLYDVVFVVVASALCGLNIEA